MLRLADPVHTAKMFVHNKEVPEHSCQFEMVVFEDKFLTNRDEIAITSKEPHLGFTIKIFDSLNQPVWWKDYPFFIQSLQTLRLPKGELKIPIKVSAPIRGIG
jgi:hypothetical protein